MGFCCIWTKNITLKENSIDLNKELKENTKKRKFLTALTVRKTRDLMIDYILKYKPIIDWSIVPWNKERLYSGL